MNYRIPVIISSLFLLGACGGKERPLDLTQHTTARHNAQIATVTEGAVTNTIQLPGQLKPYETVSIYAKVNGFVKHIYVDRGTVVHKGQVLARLEAPELQSQVQSATSRYTQAQENAVASREKYQRLREAAREPGAVAELDLNNALQRMKADAAAVQTEKASLASTSNVSEYLTITAPFDGVIVQRNVSVGALAGSGKAGDQPMFILEQASRLRLEVMVPEVYADKVNFQDDAAFSINAKPGTTFKGKISRSANALGSMRSEAIEIDVPNADGQLKPGMYAEVKIPLQTTTKSLIVPASAIVRSTERLYVIVVQNGKARFEDVKEGMKAKDSTEIFGNLRPGEQVLLSATDDIKEGSPL